VWFRVGIFLSLLGLLWACAKRPPTPPLEVTPATARWEREMQKARELEAKGKDQDALLIYNRILKEAPLSPVALDARLEAAQIYEKRGYLDKAQELLEFIVSRTGPQQAVYHKAHLMLARIWYNKANREKALLHFKLVNPSFVASQDYEKLKSLLAPPPSYYLVLAKGEAHGLEEEVSQVKRGIELALEGSGVRLVEAASPDELEGLKGTPLGVVGPLLFRDLDRFLTWANRKGVPLISPSFVRPDLTSQSPLLFRTSMPLDHEVAYMAWFLASQLKIHNLAIFYPDSPYGRVTSKLMEDAFTKRGGEIDMERSYPTDTVDFTPLASELANWKKAHVLPQALYVPDTWKRVVLLAPQLVFHNVRGITLVGTALWNNPRLAKNGKGYLDYAIFADTFTLGSSYLPVLEFYYRYKMTYGRDPTPLAAQAYDAAKALLASRDKEKGLTPLGSVRFLGVTGMVGFDEKGDPLRVPALLMVEGGRIRQIN